MESESTSGSTEEDTSVNGLTALCKDSESFDGPMEKDSKASGWKAKSMDLGLLIMAVNQVFCKNGRMGKL